MAETSGERAEAGVVDGDDLAGQQAELVRRATRREREAEDAEAEAERHEHRGDRVALASTRAEQADDGRRDERAEDGALHDTDPEQERRGRSRERQLADAVHREREVAGHHEDADQSADDPEHGAGDHGVVQQREQLPVVGEVEEHRPPVVHDATVPSWS